MPADAAPLTLSTRQVADALGCSLNTIYKLLDSGGLRSFYVGTRRRVRLADLEEFMANGGAR